MTSLNTIFFSILILLSIGCINTIDDDSQEPGCWTPPAELPEIDGRTNWVAFFKNDTVWQSVRSSTGSLAGSILAGSTIDINYQDFGESDIIGVFAEMKINDSCQDIYSQFSFSFANPQLGETDHIGENTRLSDYILNKSYFITYDNPIQVNITKLDHEENRIEGFFSFDMVSSEDDQDTLRIREGRFQGNF